MSTSGGLENNLQVPSSSNLVYSSLNQIAIQASGYHDNVVKTLSGNNTSESINIFKITGTIFIVNLFAEVVRVGTLSNLTAGYLDLWDGTASVNISKDGVVLSGEPEGTFLAKVQNNTNILTKVSSSVGTVEETTTKDPFFGFFLNKKNGADTFIRWNYTTTDTPIDADIEFHLIWRPINGGDVVAV